MTKALLEINWKNGFAERDHRYFTFDGTYWTEAAAIHPTQPNSFASTRQSVIGTGRQGLYKILRQWLALDGKDRGKELSIGEHGYMLDSRLKSMSLKHLGEDKLYVAIRREQPVMTHSFREFMDLVEKTFPEKAPKLRRPRPSNPSPS